MRSPVSIGLNPLVPVEYPRPWGEARAFWDLVPRLVGHESVQEAQGSLLAAAPGTLQETDHDVVSVELGLLSGVVRADPGHPVVHVGGGLAEGAESRHVEGIQESGPEVTLLCLEFLARADLEQGIDEHLGLAVAHRNVAQRTQAIGQGLHELPKLGPAAHGQGVLVSHVATVDDAEPADLRDSGVERTGHGTLQEEHGGGRASPVVVASHKVGPVDLAQTLLEGVSVGQVETQGDSLHVLHASLTNLEGRIRNGQTFLDEGREILRHVQGRNFPILTRDGHGRNNCPIRVPLDHVLVFDTLGAEDRGRVLDLPARNADLNFLHPVVHFPGSKEFRQVVDLLGVVTEREEGCSTGAEAVLNAHFLFSS